MMLTPGLQHLQQYPQRQHSKTASEAAQSGYNDHQLCIAGSGPARSPGGLCSSLYLCCIISTDWVTHVPRPCTQFVLPEGQACWKWAGTLWTIASTVRVQTQKVQLGPGAASTVVTVLLIAKNKAIQTIIRHVHSCYHVPSSTTIDPCRTHAKQDTHLLQTPRLTQFFGVQGCPLRGASQWPLLQLMTRLHQMTQPWQHHLKRIGRIKGVQSKHGSHRLRICKQRLLHPAPSCASQHMQLWECSYGWRWSVPQAALGCCRLAHSHRATSPFPVTSPPMPRAHLPWVLHCCTSAMRNGVAVAPDSLAATASGQ
jgi:hypothetical protein